MSELSVTVRDLLTPAETKLVQELVADCTDVDEAAPFSEQVILNLRHKTDPSVRHVLAMADGVLAGYAQLDTSHPIEGPSAEIAVAPAFRRKGYATSLLSALMIQVQPQALRLWAHGDATSAASLAQAFGFREVRTLWQMRRSLFAPLPKAADVGAVTFRRFQPGVDDAAWLHANSVVFAAHPEQGRWTHADLTARINQSWFDASGFILATSGDGAIVGFCWTKIHGDQSDARYSHTPIGELYVLGVMPEWRRRGLARALAIAGLRHLQNRGLDTAMLFVDANDQAAMSLYENLGFARWDRVTMFQDPYSPA